MDTIKLEIGLREPLLHPVFSGGAKTILLSPSSGDSLVEPLKLRSISRLEAFAEKFRAALSRREVAIRDFYDLDYAIGKELIRPEMNNLLVWFARKFGFPAMNQWILPKPALLN
jgi:hypothetical protein